MTVWDITFVSLLLVAIDLAYWTQACLAASYGVRDPEYDWMAPYGLGFKIPRLIIRYIPLTFSGVMLLLSGNSADTSNTTFLAACGFLLLYVVLAGHFFYIDLQNYLAKRT